MQKLSGTSSCKNNKSCASFHLEPKKIGFAFFCFFYDFLRNLQESATSTLLFELPIVGRPSKRTFSLQCGPWDGQRRSGGDSGRGSPDSGRGRVGEWPRGYWGSICGLGRGEELPVGGSPSGRQRQPPRAVLRRSRESPALARGVPRRGVKGRHIRANVKTGSPFMQESRTGLVRRRRQHAAGTTPDGSRRGSPRGARPRGTGQRYGAARRRTTSQYGVDRVKQFYSVPV
jgi:hypothetical protein